MLLRPTPWWRTSRSITCTARHVGRPLFAPAKSGIRYGHGNRHESTQVKAEGPTKFLQRRFSFVVKDPQRTPSGKILAHFAHHSFKEVENQGRDQDAQQALVILATPSFAQSVSDHAGFLPQVLQGLIGPLEKTSEIDILVAVVDGLSPNLSKASRTEGLTSDEGFSILRGTQSSLLPNLWNEEISSSTIRSNDLLSSITISATPGPTPKVTLPLANTLFRNGRHSTLEASRWRFENGNITKVKSQAKNGQIINISDDRNFTGFSTIIPVVPLTPARRIVSGLGNIVRQLDFHRDGGVGPASRELEASMDEYLEARKGEKTNVAVWALVVPADVAKLQTSEPSGTGSYGGSELLVDQAEIKLSWSKPSLDTGFVGNWIDMGATFCRVLSGGGGWGPKQGLLSLDPQTTYSQVDEPDFSFMGVSFEDSSSSLGDLAKPGAYIQFFVADENSALRLEQANDGNSVAAVVGTKASTVDEMPDVSGSKISDAADNELFIHHDGHFGGVSEVGMFLESSRQDARDVEVKSKIDLPDSFCTWRSL